MQEQGSTSTSGSGSSSSNPTIENMAPGSARMANPLRPPVWVQVKSRARVEEQRQESQQEEGKEMWDLLLDQEPKPLPLSLVPMREEKWFFACLKGLMDYLTRKERAWN